MPNPLYPNLPSGIPNEVEGRRARNAAEGCWPSWSREAKAKDADQRLWESILERQRESFRQGMREWRERWR
jgi:hypothetical protein